MLFNGLRIDAVNAAAAVLARGELLAFATETVYGLGARADVDAAVAKIFAAKGRPAWHPLIVHVAQLSTMPAFAASVPDWAQQLAQHYWPGPLTLIVPRRAGVAAAAAGGAARTSIGLRCPAHTAAQALLQAAADLGVPGVAAPSANRFGRVSPTLAEHVLEEFAGRVPVLDGGACSVGIESTIVDCTGAAPALLRPGVIARAAMEQLLGLRFQAHSALQVSGSLASHYAPTALVRVLPLADLDAAQHSAAVQNGSIRLYRLPAQPEQAAHDLFAQLRALDQPGVTAIWVSAAPSGAAWDGVRDRLQRAAFRAECGS